MLAKNLYSQLFTWLVDKLNGATNAAKSPYYFVGILDIFGFEDFAPDGGKNSLEQLCINYCNETLQQYFNVVVFEKERADLGGEGIDVEVSTRARCCGAVCTHPPMLVSRCTLCVCVTAILRALCNRLQAVGRYWIV